MAGRLMSCIVAVGCLEEVGYYSLVFGFEMGQKGGFAQEFVLQPIFSVLWHYM
jgi:hypothetical protein